MTILCLILAVVSVGLIVALARFAVVACRVAELRDALALAEAETEADAERIARLEKAHAEAWAEVVALKAARDALEVERERLREDGIMLWRAAEGATKTLADAIDRARGGPAKPKP